MTTVSAEKSSSPWGVRFCFEDGQREGRRGERTRDDKVGSIVRLFSYQPLIDFSCLVNPTTRKPAVRQLPLALERRERRGGGGGGANLLTGGRDGVFGQVVGVGRVGEVFSKRRRDDFRLDTLFHPSQTSY